MYRVTTTWKNAPNWPGNEFCSTVAHMKTLGATQENLDYGVNLIFSLNPIFIDFIPPGPADEFSWKTIIGFSDESSANQLISYLENRAKIEANELNFDLVYELELV